MEKKIYITTLLLTIIEPDDYLRLGTDEEEYNNIFPIEKDAIKKAKQLFEEYQVSKTKEVNSVVGVWAAVWLVVTNEQGAKTRKRIFNLYKNQETDTIKKVN